jgi:hypothetical protein
MTEKAEKIIQGLSLAFKILAGVMLFLGLAEFLISSLIAILAQHSPLGPNSLFEQSGLLAFVLKNFGGLAFGQVAFSIFIFYTSVQFSKFQAWARTGFELIVWILLIFNLGVGVFLMTSGPANLSSFVKTMVVLYMGFWVIFFFIVIGLLQKREIREAFKSK